MSIQNSEEAIWCLFGVYFLEALESTSETQETIETSLKRKKIKELFSKSFPSRDLRYGTDENPSLSASIACSRRSLIARKGSQLEHKENGSHRTPSTAGRFAGFHFL